MRTHCASVLAGALLLAGASPARAQSVADSLAELQSSLKPGQTVTVTSRDGREMRGRVVSLSPSTLEIAQNNSTTVLTEGDIATISRRDSPWNGMLWGLAAGAVLGAVAEKSIADYYDEGSDGSLAVLGGAAGAGIGFALDALISGRNLIFSASGTRAAMGGRVSLTAGGGALRLSVRW